MFIVHKLPDTRRGHEGGADILSRRRPVRRAEPTSSLYRRPTRDEIATLEARAQQFQAQALRDGASFLARGLVGGIRKLVSVLGSFLASYGETLAARRAYDVLSRLSDHELADMGLTREQIPDVIWRRPRRAQDRPVARAAEQPAGQDYCQAA